MPLADCSSCTLSLSRYVLISYKTACRHTSHSCSPLWSVEIYSIICMLGTKWPGIALPKAALLVTPALPATNTACWNSTHKAEPQQVKGRAAGLTDVERDKCYKTLAKMFPVLPCVVWFLILIRWPDRASMAPGGVITAETAEQASKFSNSSLGVTCVPSVAEERSSKSRARF